MNLNAEVVEEPGSSSCEREERGSLYHQSSRVAKLQAEATRRSRCVHQSERTSKGVESCIALEMSAETIYVVE